MKNGKDERKGENEGMKEGENEQREEEEEGGSKEARTSHGLPYPTLPIL